jgi:signal transduction histidine kinase
MKNARMGLHAHRLTTLRRAARDSHWRLQQHNKTLRLHAAALASGNRRLEREVARRKAGEGIIRKGKEEYRMLFLESQVMQGKLRQLTRQIIWAQEEERKEISRELHDEVVQTLVGINVQLSALGKGASVGLHALKEKIARTQRLVENSVNAVHRFARELRPAVLDDLGLIPALHAYSKSLAARKKLKIKMTAFGGVEALGGAKRIVFFRVAQEALTNVARHAHATQIRMTISEISGAIRMEINDNGKSFDVGKALSAKNPKRLGLIGMKERVEMVGGTLAIQSTPAKGTTVRAEIPFNQVKKTK